ncbi:MAG: VanZ family protein [Candidatus Delongbacteria bacterium]
MNPFVLYSRLPRWVDLIVLAFALAVVWLGSSIPPDSFPDLRIFSYDKLLHVLEYTCLGIAIWVAGRRHGLVDLRTRLHSPLKAYLLGVVLPGALWAVSDELHQLVVGRSCSVWDWVADLLGLLLAVWFCRTLEKRWDWLREPAA